MVAQQIIVIDPPGKHPEPHNVRRSRDCTKKINKAPQAFRQMHGDVGMVLSLAEQCSMPDVHAPVYARLCDRSWVYVRIDAQKLK